ncbi:MAG: aldo/keto reductase [Candidatus Sumerlaeota bacterium]|nr:aldo/keto reductase [Candidatus Sumerlaeota bacterium]
MLSPVGFGAQRTRDEGLIRYALDQGMNHIETSWGYGFGLPGNSCQCIAKAIAGKRDSVCLAVAFEAGAPPESKAWLPHQFEQTLRDLGADHIDVFLWHHPQIEANGRKMTLRENQAVVASGERVDLMLKWKAEGKIRWCGVTMHNEQEEWLRFVGESGLYDVAVVAFNYKSPKTVADAMQEASRKGIGLIAMKTQSPNYLDSQATIGDAPDHREALNWVLSKDYVTAAIPGMTTRDQVDLNRGVMSALEAPQSRAFASSGPTR